LVGGREKELRSSGNLQKDQGHLGTLLLKAGQAPGQGGNYYPPGVKGTDGCEDKGLRQRETWRREFPSNTEPLRHSFT